jgi:GNAT superfamily N-acetyltransferase
MRGGGPPSITPGLQSAPRGRTPAQTIGRAGDDRDVTTNWTVTETPVAEATDLLRRYFHDVASGFYGRPATSAEVKAAMAEDPSDDLVPPGAVFLVGSRDGTPAGCVGLRFGPTSFAELTRMFVVREARGLGGGSALLAAAEERARRHGVRTVRLDTRLDLLAARGLYATHGYQEIPAYSHGPYAQCWYAKNLH